MATHSNKIVADHSCTLGTAEQDYVAAVRICAMRCRLSLNNNGGVMPGTDFARFIANGGTLDRFSGHPNSQQVQNVAAEVRSALFKAADNTTSNPANIMSDFRNAQLRYKASATAADAIGPTGSTEQMTPQGLKLAINRHYADQMVNPSATGPGYDMPDLVPAHPGHTEARLLRHSRAHVADERGWHWRRRPGRRRQRRAWCAGWGRCCVHSCPCGRCRMLRLPVQGTLSSQAAVDANCQGGRTVEPIAAQDCRGKAWGGFLAGTRCNPHRSASAREENEGQKQPADQITLPELSRAASLWPRRARVQGMRKDGERKHSGDGVHHQAPPSSFLSRSSTLRSV